jgi:hypothetical protein
MAYDGRSDEVGNCNLGPVCSPRRFLNPVQFSQHHVAAFCLAGILEANDGCPDVLETVAILWTSSPTVFLLETFGKINTFLEA